MLILIYSIRTAIEKDKQNHCCLTICLLSLVGEKKKHQLIIHKDKTWSIANNYMCMKQHEML